MRLTAIYFMESEENEGLELGQRSSHIRVMRSRNFYRRGRKLCLILRSWDMKFSKYI